MYMYVLYIYMYIHCTWIPHSVCIYHYGICHWVLSCTAFDIGMFYAIMQESTIVYKQGFTYYTSYIPPKNGCWDNWLKHVCTLHTCTYTVDGYHILAHSVCIYHYGICHCILACTVYEPGWNNATLQELAILYRQGSYRNIHPKNGIYPLSM